MEWLFVPLGDDDVLVAGERVLYRSRRHWAAVLPEVVQFAAVTFLVSVFFVRGSIGIGAIVLAGLVASVLVLRPLVRRDRWSPWSVAAVALVVAWVVSLGAGPTILGLLLVVTMGVRAAIRVLRWALYQRTYLTDRRVMEVDGFLGARIDSMPLVKVTDVSLHRSPLGEVLGYGTFRVESAGQHQALGTLDFLVAPDRFHDLVVASHTWQQ